MIGIIIFSTPAQAQLQWNSFGTIGIGRVGDESVVADTNLEYSGFTEDFSTQELTLLGIQPTYRFKDNLSFTLQSVTRQSEDFKLELEWGYLNYDYSDNTVIRLGLIRRPLFQNTESAFVGFGSRWVQPPSTVYLDIDELYGNIAAVDVLYNGVLGSWLYSTELYFGVGAGEGNFAGFETRNESDQNFGAVLSVEQGNYALRFGAHHSKFSISIDEIDLLAQSLRQIGLNEVADDILLEDEGVTFYSIGGSYLSDDWEVFGETVVIDIENTVVPKMNAWYVGLQRRFGDVAVHVTTGEQITKSPLNPASDIAALAGQVDAATAAALIQIGQQLAPIVQMGDASRFSTSIGLRYDLKSNIALKAEVERVNDRLNDRGTTMISFSVDFVY